jgi:diaminopimelate decarboxylase
MLPEAVVHAVRAAARPVCAYVYQRAALRAAAARVRAALPAGATLLYAVKANGHPAVVETLAARVDGLEVASGGELALAEAALSRVAAARSAPAGRIAFGGPAKTDAELAAARRAGALIHVESPHELRRLALLASPDEPAPVAVRVNRPDPAPTGTHAMAGAPTPFGVAEADLPAVLALAARLPVRVVGFSLHAVSNSLDATAYAGFVRDAVRWARAAAARHGLDLAYVNVGGGLGVDYTGVPGSSSVPGRSFDLAALRAGLAGLAPDDAARLVLEPGRYLAADAGWYAAEVLDLKRVYGRWFAVLRGGTHHFRLPAAWRYSHPFTVLPVTGWPYPFDRPEVRDVPVDAAGELCTPRDVLTRGQPVSRLRVGDVLVFGNAGAYGWDISHHEFLRHPHPETVVV